MENFLRLKRDFVPELTSLIFANGNRKFSGVTTFSLPAGHSCLFAKDCRSCAIRNPRKRHDIGDTRKYIIQDGPDTIFRCFAAIDEAMKPTIREARWRNYFILLTVTKLGSGRR